LKGIAVKHVMLNVRIRCKYEKSVVMAAVQDAEPAQMVAIAHDSKLVQACLAHSLLLSRLKLIFSRLS
jgi:hypothetical protein